MKVSNEARNKLEIEKLKTRQKESDIRLYKDCIKYKVCPHCSGTLIEKDNIIQYIIAFFFPKKKYL